MRYAGTGFIIFGPIDVNAAARLPRRAVDARVSVHQQQKQPGLSVILIERGSGSCAVISGNFSLLWECGRTSVGSDLFVGNSQQIHASLFSWPQMDSARSRLWWRLLRIVFTALAILKFAQTLLPTGDFLGAGTCRTHWRMTMDRSSKV